MKCSFCGKPTKKKYMLDFLGRVYCKRWLCDLSIWYNKNVYYSIRIGKWRIKND